jgi:hypothetical protein
MIIAAKTLLQSLPILGAGVIAGGDDVTKLSTATIISRVLELGIVGAILLYAMVQVMNTKIEQMKEMSDKHNTKCEIMTSTIIEMQKKIMRLDWEHEQQDGHYNKPNTNNTISNIRFKPITKTK